MAVCGIAVVVRAGIEVVADLDGVDAVTGSGVTGINRARVVVVAVLREELALAGRPDARIDGAAVSVIAVLRSVDAIARRVFAQILSAGLSSLHDFLSLMQPVAGLHESVVHLSPSLQSRARVRIRRWPAGIRHALLPSSQSFGLATHPPRTTSQTSSVHGFASGADDRHMES